MKECPGLFCLLALRAAVQDDVESLRAWQLAGADLNLEDYHHCTPLDMVRGSAVYACTLCMLCALVFVVCWVCVYVQMCCALCVVLCAVIPLVPPCECLQANQHNSQNSIDFLTQCGTVQRCMCMTALCHVHAPTHVVTMATESWCCLCYIATGCA